MATAIEYVNGREVKAGRTTIGYAGTVHVEVHQFSTGERIAWLTDTLDDDHLMLASPDSLRRLAEHALTAARLIEEAKRS